MTQPDKSRVWPLVDFAAISAMQYEFEMRTGKKPTVVVVSPSLARHLFGRDFDIYGNAMEVHGMRIVVGDFLEGMQAGVCRPTPTRSEP